MTIQTTSGKKRVTRRTNEGAYYQTVPTLSAPNGEWWTLNPQRGFVPVPSNGRALLSCLACE